MTDKLETANAVLATFAPDTHIERRRGGWFVCWTTRRGESFSRRWSTRRGQDFYPPWSNKWPHGGTGTTALSQLIRWLRGQPVLPLSTWRYWFGPVVRLGRDDGSSAIPILLAGCYPEYAECVLCHERIAGGLDWWSLDGVSGPCCGWTTGCRQKPQDGGKP